MSLELPTEIVHKSSKLKLIDQENTGHESIDHRVIYGQVTPLTKAEAFNSLGLNVFRPYMVITELDYGIAQGDILEFNGRITVVTQGISHWDQDPGSNCTVIVVDELENGSN